VNVENHLYVFDSYSREQCIHKYSITYDIWESIEYKTVNFDIPRTNNNMAFRFSDTQILLLNGNINSNKSLSLENKMTYHIYSLEKEIFTQERIDKKLINSCGDRQGNKDYRYSQKVFCQLTDRTIKCFHKQNYMWDCLPVHVVKIKKNVEGMEKMLGCFGGKD
jgi:hypothetical protein